jgi:hypothetical protein
MSLIAADAKAVARLTLIGRVRGRIARVCDSRLGNAAASPVCLVCLAIAWSRAALKRESAIDRLVASVLSTGWHGLFARRGNYCHAVGWIRRGERPPESRGPRKKLDLIIF